MENEDWVLGVVGEVYGRAEDDTEEVVVMVEVEAEEAAVCELSVLQALQS